MSTRIWQDFEMLKEQHWVASDFRGRGEMEFRGQLRFSGQWTGSIRSDDPEARLYILEGARIEGRIHVAHVMVGGFLVDAHVEAQSFQALATAKIAGYVRAERMQIEEGAVLEGVVGAKRS
jgi:cytoskeletal protein CcmA (bactofilin family)